MKRNLPCCKESCRAWIDNPGTLNCSVVSAMQDGPKTLQEIGEIFGVTRMRICQIEKAIMEKLRVTVEEPPKS